MLAVSISMSFKSLNEAPIMLDNFWKEKMRYGTEGTSRVKKKDQVLNALGVTEADLLKS
jgi:hypothetical protein